MPRTKKVDRSALLFWQLLALALFVITACVVVSNVLYMTLSSHDAKVNAYGDDSLQVVTGKHSIVVNAAKASDGLVAFLEKDDGCQKHNATYIITEADENFARLQYGCSENTGFAYTVMDTKNVNGKWSFISPTNNFFSGIPLCSYLKKNKISSHSVEPLCVEGGNPINNTKPYSYDLRENPVKE